MTWSSFPIFSYAASASSRSFRFRPAVTMFRMRALSRATSGKTIGTANTFSSNSRLLNFCASAESPSITGVIGVSLCPMSKPRFTRRFLKYFVFDHSFFTWRGSVSSTSIAAMHDAVVDGVGVPLRSHARGLCPGHVAADDPEGLRERPELDVDLLLDVEVGRDAAASVPEDALSVGVGDVQHRT